MRHIVANNKTMLNKLYKNDNMKRQKKGGSKKKPSKREGENFSMSCKEVKVDTHIFYAFLKWKARILADEKDKKKFLDFALSSWQDGRIPVLAFVILDDEMHFLVQDDRKEKTGKTAGELWKECANYVKKEYSKAPDSIQEESRFQEIMSKTEMLDICRHIHRLPLNQGYVKRIKDYWWSSFQTYRGGYRWPGMDTFSILRNFTEDTEKGRMLFLRYHWKES